MRKSKKGPVDRRSFLKNAAVGAAMIASNPVASRAGQIEARNAARVAPPAPIPAEALKSLPPAPAVKDIPLLNQ